MKHKIITSSVVPTLFILTGTISYLAIINGWNFEIVSYAIFLFTLVYILIFEHIIPLKKEWKPKKTTIWTDIKHLIFSTAIFDVLGKVMSLSLVLYIQEYFFNVSYLWDIFPFFATYIIASLIGEILPYLYHRISHKGNPNSFFSLLLWKIHSIHHLPTHLNWFKTNWIHPINMFLNTFLKMMPLLVLGFSKNIIFLVGVTHVVVAYLSHANIRTAKSMWDYLIVTPQIHHFHHSTKMEEAKNFGNILPFWDLLFGTYYNRKGTVDTVGVVKDSKTNYPQDKAYFKQLIFPLLMFKKCCT
ncbi:sterol desaturase family protein [Winogradskyella sp.]|uniref:sterol desaturase family protein n=1 Tax=Winogradskyella sp. TaxID=1883156 RepID=UPI003AB1A52C